MAKAWRQTKLSPSRELLRVPSNLAKHATRGIRPSKQEKHTQDTDFRSHLASSGLKYLFRRCRNMWVCHVHGYAADDICEIWQSQLLYL